MKKNLFILLSILFAFPAFGAPKAVKFDVYPNSAKAVFQMEIDGKAAESIPAAFLPQSVKIISVSGAELLSFKAETAPGNFETPDFLKKTKEQIEKISSQIDKKSAILSGLELSAVILDNVNADNIKISEMADYLKKTSGMRAKTASDSAVLEKEIADLKEKLKLLQADFDKKIPADWNSVTKVTVKLRGKGKVLLEAETKKAGWTPLYSFDLNTDTGEIRSTLAASVRQNTGIDWNGSFVFHSSRPIFVRPFLDLPPVVADFMEKAYPAPQVRESLKMSSAVNAEETAFSEGSSTAQTAAGVEIKIKASVDGDGIPAEIPIEKFTMSSEAGFEIIPEYSPYAVITAKVEKTPKPILSGKGLFYIDGSFSGETGIEGTPQGSQTILAFGETRDVYAYKKENIALKGSSWIKGSLEDGYEIEAFNGSEKNLKITVKDRIPIPADAKITVTDVKMTPPGKETGNGVYSWTLSMKPKERTNISVSYKIKFPSDREIIFR